MSVSLLLDVQANVLRLFPSFAMAGSCAMSLRSWCVTVLPLLSASLCDPTQYLFCPPLLVYRTRLLCLSGSVSDTVYTCPPSFEMQPNFVRESLSSWENRLD